MTPVKYSEFFHKKIKNSELVIIDNAGHLAMIEQPKGLNKAIENYIKNCL
jgi:pimeloyl-ACP methyl ester carboxylesterase